MFIGRIDITDNHANTITIWHTMKDLSTEEIEDMVARADGITAALGPEWKIWSNDKNGRIVIGPASPQTDDAKKVLGVEIPTPKMSDVWLTAAEVETEYGLPASSVRRDIHRKKFAEDEFRKVGRDWTVRMDAAEKRYGKKA